MNVTINPDVTTGSARGPQPGTDIRYEAPVRWHRMTWTVAKP